MSSFLKTLTKGKEKIKSAFGKGDSTPPSPAELLETQRKKVLGYHALAQQRVDQVQKTPGVDRNPKVQKLMGDLSTLSADVKDKIEKAAKTDELETQRLRIDKIYTDANGVVVAAKGPSNLKDFEKARLSARDTLGEMRGLPGATNYDPLKTAIEGADKLLVKLTTVAGDAATKEEVKKCTTALDIFPKLLTDAKSKSAEYLKGAPKNIGDFEKKRKSASDRISDVRSLRDSDDEKSAVGKRLDEADKLLSDITIKARAAKVKEENVVEEQIKRLAEIEVIAKDVEKLAAEAKKLEKSDVKAGPKYKEMLAKVKRERDSLLDVGVANEEYLKLTELIANSELTLHGEGPTAALTMLSGYTTHVTSAQNKQKDLKTKVSPPAVAKAVQAIEPFLKKLETGAAEYVAKMHRAECEKLTLLGNTEEKEAVDKLELLLVTVEKEVNTAETQKKEATSKLQDFQREAMKLVSDGYKESFFAVPMQLANLAASQDIPARDWARAIERLDDAKKGIADVTSEQEKSKLEWEKGATERANLRKLATTVVDWPPLSSKANTVLGYLTQVETEFAKTGDYVGTLKLYKELNVARSVQWLQDTLAEEKKMGMPADDDLADIRKALQVANGEFVKAMGPATKNLQGLAAAMKDMADPSSTELQTLLDTVEEEWDKVWLNEPPRNTKAVDIPKVVEPYISRANTINDRAIALLKDPTALKQYEDESKTFDAKKADGKLAKALPGMLDQLERLKMDVSAERKTLADLLDDKTSPEDRAKGLLKLQTDLSGLIASNKRFEENRSVKTKEAVNRVITGPLKRIDGRHKEFQDYQKDLKKDADDIVAMTETGDPYFQRQARLDTLGLSQKIKEVDPTQRGEDGARYKAVEERWNALSKGLGGDMKEMLPNTWAELKKSLTTKIGESRKMSPKDALKHFDDIEKLINAAKERVVVAKAEKEKVKVRRERLEKQWAQVKKDTRTRVTDRVTDFAKALERRVLGEVDGALKEENGSKRANTILQTLEDQLRKVETSDDPRAALQKLDSDAAQEQRAIRDMARAFEEELTYFKETTLPQARKAMKERASERKTFLEKVKSGALKVANKIVKVKVGETDLDEELLESLESTAVNAAKPVQSYLNMVSTTGIGAAKSPELSVAQSAFQSARGMLTSAQRTVDSLSTVTGGTSMGVTMNLTKVEANWKAQSANYAKQALGMVSAMRDRSKEDPDNVKQSVEKAAKIVTDASHAFHGNAFSAEITVMEKKDGTNDTRLAAREKILTAMRAYRKVLTKHPVHVHIADPANPFTEGKIRAAARSVLVALKRIELETLIGV